MNYKDIMNNYDNKTAGHFDYICEELGGKLFPRRLYDLRGMLWVKSYHIIFYEMHKKAKQINEL